MMLTRQERVGAQPDGASAHRAAAMLDPLDAELIRHSIYIPSDAAHAARGPLGPWQAARRLGVHGTTVKARLSALRTHGVMSEAALVPHAALLGRRLFNYRLAFGSAAAKERNLGAVGAEPSVLSVRDFMGSEAWIGIYAASPTEAEGIAADLQARSRAAGAALVYEATGQAPRVALSPLDRRILRFLAPNAHASNEAVSRAAGVSSRTVRRRLARLHGAHALALVPNLDLRSIGGALPTMVEVRLDPRRRPAGVLDALPERVHREIPRPDLVLVYLVAPNLGAVQELAARAQGADGVAQVTTRFILGVRVNPRAILAALA